MKKKQLKISDLKVKSFVTAVEGDSSNTVKGMGTFFGCGTNGPQREICPNTIFPDQSFCNDACITNVPDFCEFL